jgi:phospholipid transport system substrate-binding protein
MRFPLLTVVLVSITAQILVASTQEAEDFLKSAVNEVVGLASKSQNSADLAERVRPVLIRTISFPDMTRLAIGPGWREFSKQDRDQATAMFTNLIIRTYSARFTPGELPEVSYKSAVSTAPNKVDLTSTTLYQGSRYEVVYRLTDLPEQGWRVTDVIIEGVSMVRTYRDQFDNEFKSGGVSAVLSSLNRTLNYKK